MSQTTYGRELNSTYKIRKYLVIVTYAPLVLLIDTNGSVKFRSWIIIKYYLQSNPHLLFIGPNNCKQM